MMHIISKEQVAACVREHLPEVSFVLPPDICAALERAAKSETSARGREVLTTLLENAQIARDEQVPLCQDTGSVWCCLEVGPEVCLCADVMDGVNDAVADVYEAHSLRKSLVRDALFDRTNTGTNAPAFVEVKLSERPGARLHIMCKGGGSDNASRVVMLAPGQGRAGVIDAVLGCVREKAANACPPLVVGIGIGSTFDKVASLAKMALMRPLDTFAQSSEGAVFEAELLTLINETGIGPAALGGTTTALGVHVESAPCHIAALPVAINMGCTALRRATYELA